MALEQIVLCDEQGSPTGTAEKLTAHHANTPLHLAFSCYVFNQEGLFLVTKRAASKKVWPGVWTNSVCGHPAPGESMEQAIIRRAEYELGIRMRAVTNLVTDYRYRTPPFKGIIENEFCPIFAARTADTPRPNTDEVDDYKWMKWEDYIAALEHDSTAYSWWAKDQLAHLPPERLSAYLKPV